MDLDSCATGGSIPVGGTYTCSYTALVSGNAGDILQNILTVTIEDDETNIASNSSSVSITVVDALPAITVAVSPIPSTISEPGGTITYLVSVNNTLLRNPLH